MSWGRRGSWRREEEEEEEEGHGCRPQIWIPEIEYYVGRIEDSILGLIHERAIRLQLLRAGVH